MRYRSLLVELSVCCLLPPLLAGCGGGGAPSPGSAPAAPGPPATGPSGPYLAQIAPGAVPSIRVGVATPSIPSPSETFAFLIYRCAGQAFFSTTPATLIEIVQAQRLPAYDDGPAQRLGLTFNGRRSFIGPGGTPDTYTVTATYNDPALLPGTTYYYRIRRLTDPQFGPGVNPPDVAGLQAPAASLNISRSDVLSQPSAPLGPVTYFLPPTPLSPPDGATGLQTTCVTFRWNRTSATGGRGADEYVIEVFPSNDPGTLGNPLFRSPTLMPVGAGSSMTWDLTGVALGPGARFYWRVGARRRGEAYPRVDTLPGASGYLWSTVRSFQTGLAPPPIP